MAYEWFPGMMNILRLNWVGQYDEMDGYGRFNSRFAKALIGIGADIRVLTHGHVNMPEWLRVREGVDWGRLTITCSPPFLLNTTPIPGPHWFYSMTEGSRISDEWVKRIEVSGVQRVIVPCEHNAKAFRDSGVELPVSVLPGGVDPHEFPERPVSDFKGRPYTFLTFSDRGARKGWEEVWEAFYKAFGGKTTGNQNVRLLIKGRRNPDSLPTFLSGSDSLDKRVTFLLEDIDDVRDIYTQADCLVLPSRSEGWGMMHREAASMGIPVITQKYSGMDDGKTEEWALVVEGGKMQPIPQHVALSLGEWMIADVSKLAEVMTYVALAPDRAASFGARAASWIRDNQTWRHSALRLVELTEGVKHGNVSMGCSAIRSPV